MAVVFRCICIALDTDNVPYRCAAMGLDSPAAKCEWCLDGHHPDSDGSLMRMYHGID